MMAQTIPDFTYGESTEQHDLAAAATFSKVMLSNNGRPKAAFAEDLVIDAASRVCVDHVFLLFDASNIEAILMRGPGKDARIEYFFRGLVKRIRSRKHLHSLKVFVKKLATSDVISQLIEREFFLKAQEGDVKKFMDFHVAIFIEKSFNRNVLTALFGNPNISISFLKGLSFDVNARGIQDFTALHYAVQSGHLGKVRLLLDRGADPNLVASGNEAPLVLTLREPQIKFVDNKACAELLLQHGANPFLQTSGGESFASCLYSDNESHKYMSELVLAYVRIYKSTANWARENADLLINIECAARRNTSLANFYMKCEEQIRMLKKISIHRDLTMFDVISKTGYELIELLDDRQERKIAEFVDYKSRRLLHSYYVKALKEHMRHFRILLTSTNRAILASQSNAATGFYYSEPDTPYFQPSYYFQYPEY